MSLIDGEQVAKLIEGFISDDVQESIDAATDKAIEELKPMVRHRIASKVLSTINSEYSVIRMGNILEIKVKIED